MLEPGCCFFCASFGGYFVKSCKESGSPLPPGSFWQKYGLGYCCALSDGRSSRILAKYAHNIPFLWISPCFPAGVFQKTNRNSYVSLVQCHIIDGNIFFLKRLLTFLLLGAQNPGSAIAGVLYHALSSRMFRLYSCLIQHAELITFAFLAKI